MTPLKRLILTSCAFLALAVLLSLFTAPYLRDAERHSAAQSTYAVARAKG
jgi:hypothetical protein